MIDKTTLLYHREQIEILVSLMRDDEVDRCPELLYQVRKLQDEFNLNFDKGEKNE